MFYLILWINSNPPTTSIMTEKEIKMRKNKVVGLWNNRWYAAKIVKISEDYQYLDNIEIDEKGNIIQAEEITIAKDIINAAVDPNLENSNNNNENERNISNNINLSISDANEQMETVPTDNIHEASSSTETDNQNNEKVQLVKEYDILVNNAELAHLKRSWREKPKELTRRVMKIIIGTEELKTMTPTGRGGTKPIPKNIYDAVFIFVKQEISNKNILFTKDIYRRTLTNMCNTLRNPKKK